MIAEQREGLKRDYPFILGGPWENHLGGGGYESLIRELAEIIEKPLQQWWQDVPKNSKGSLGHPRITQLAVEAGGLKVYMSFIPAILEQRINDAIDQVERCSFEVCVDCGSPGTLRIEDNYFSQSAIATLCDDCFSGDDDDDYVDVTEYDPFSYGEFSDE